MEARDGDYCLDFGVWIVVKNGRVVRVELRSIRALISALGPRGADIMRGFVVALHAVERLASFVHLGMINARVEDQSLRQRNQHALSMSIYTTFHEAMDAVEILDHAGLSAIQGADASSWQRLRDMRSRWLHKDGFTKTLRDSFGAHLGSNEIKRGLAEAPAMERYVLYDHGAGDKLFEVTHPIVLRMLLLGLREGKDERELTMERLMTSGLRATEDVMQFATLLEDTLWRTLRAAGVKLPELPTPELPTVDPALRPPK